MSSKQLAVVSCKQLAVVSCKQLAVVSCKQLAVVSCKQLAVGITAYFPLATDDVIMLTQPARKC